MAQSSGPSGPTSGAPADPFTAVGAVHAATGVATFILIATYAAVAGASLRLSGAVAALLVTAVALARVRSSRPWKRPSTGECTALAIACALGALVTNDVYNKDILWQVSLAHQAQYFDTLRLPSLSSATYSSKYDGWMVLVANLSSGLSVPIPLVVHHANLVLYPAFVLLLLGYRRALALTAPVLAAAAMAALVTGGDSVRLIAFGGPRPVALLLQTAAILVLVRVSSGPVSGRFADGVPFATCLAASGVVHNFSALTSSMLAAAIVGWALLPAGRTIRRAALGGALAYGILLGPYLWVKRTTVPRVPDAATALGAGADPLDLSQLWSLSWSEQGSLWPFWLGLGWLFVRAARQERGGLPPAGRAFAVLCASALVAPLVGLLLPQVSAVLIGTVASSRVARMVPLAPLALTLVTIGWLAHAPGGRVPRLLAVSIALASLVPGAIGAARWYRAGWPASRAVNEADLPYVSAAVLLGPHFASGRTIAGESRLTALKLAAVARGYPAFTYDAASGRWLCADYRDLHVAGEAVDPEFLVSSGEPPVGFVRRAAYRLDAVAVFERSPGLLFSPAGPPSARSCPH